MRYVIDSLIVFMVIAMVTALVMSKTTQQKTNHQATRTQNALIALHKQLQIRFAVIDGEKSPAGFPLLIQPDWFKPQTPPTNLLASPEHPWLDIAPSGDGEPNPPDPVLYRSEQAGFWYNPNLGIFRARVPHAGTERATLEAYNQINGTSLSALPHPEDDPDDSRAPIVYRPQWDGGLAPAATAWAETPPTAQETPLPSFYEQATGTRFKPQARSTPQIPSTPGAPGTPPGAPGAPAARQAPTAPGTPDARRATLRSAPPIAQPRPAEPAS